jgi:hypothetical protein
MSVLREHLTHSIDSFEVRGINSKITMLAVDIFRLVDGKVVDWIWEIYDGFDSLKQNKLLNKND